MVDEKGVEKVVKTIRNIHFSKFSPPGFRPENKQVSRCRFSFLSTFSTSPRVKENDTPKEGKRGSKNIRLRSRNGRNRMSSLQRLYLSVTKAISVCDIAVIYRLRKPHKHLQRKGNSGKNKNERWDYSTVTSVCCTSRLFGPVMMSNVPGSRRTLPSPS